MKEPNRSYDEAHISSRVRKQHNITLNMLIEDAKARSLGSLVARYMGDRRSGHH